MCPKTHFHMAQPVKGRVLKRCMMIKISLTSPVKYVLNILQPLYNMGCYNTVLDIIRFKDGSQKCIAYIEK